MKKFLITSGFIVVSVNAFAGLSLVPVANDVSGAYVGIKVGYQSGKNNFTHKSGGKKQKITFLTHKDESDFVGGVTFGYGKSVGRAYLGGEASLDYNGSKQKSESSFRSDYGFLINTEGKPSYSANLDFTPGVILTHRLLLLGRLGLGYSKYKFMADYPEVGTTVLNTTKGYLVFRYGLGLRYAVSRNVNLGLDYVHISSVDAVSFKGADKFTYEIKPTRNQFDFNVNYIFDHNGPNPNGPSLIDD